ncbi:hypothetical protein [Escherichia coli]|uniref:hypothetical protein n=1 Tax=Escherichia coli TaxID=562 RepID=UPI00203FD7CA|nr:hypothetical protein [Escherichia coli]
MSTITKEFTKEQLQQIIETDHVQCGEASALARIALASLEADGTLANEGTITATQFKLVADLYGLTSPTGGVTSFTFDAVEARDFIDGGWSCQEYVELGRFQEAVSGNCPVIPDGWVMVPVELTPDMRAAWDSAPYTDDDDNDMQAAYRAMIAAAPQWKVK